MGESGSHLGVTAHPARTLCLHPARIGGETHYMARTTQEAEPPHTAPVEAAATVPSAEEELAGATDADARSPRLTWEQRRAGRQYTLGEEIANSISHGIGAGLSIAGLVLLIVFAAMHGGGLKLLSAIVFGVSLLLEYLFSTLYHAIQPPRAKRVLRVFDHCAIYILIAGTYTPYCLVTLWGQGGLPMCCVIWGVAIAGIVIEAFSRERQPKWVSALIYLAMGWAVVFKLPALIATLPEPGLWLLLAGGLSYTVGCLFYLLKKVPYMHMVWHLFVLGGSVCHFLSVLMFVF
jgi:hemolysin III